MQRIKDFIDRRIKEAESEISSLELEADFASDPDEAMDVYYEINKIRAILSELELIKQEIWACENDIVIPSRTSKS